MKLRWFGIVGVLVSGSFVVAGCGGDDDTADGSSGKGGSSAGKGGSTSAGTGGSSAGKGGAVSTGGTGGSSAGKGGAVSTGGTGGSSAGKGGGGTSGASTGGTSQGGRAGAGVGGSNHAGGAAGQSGEGGAGQGGVSASGGEGGAGGSTFDCSMPSATGAPSIARNVQSGDPPTMTGGPIADGTYFQTSEDDYNGQGVESAEHRVVVFDQAAGRFAMTATDSSNVVLGTSLTAGLTVASPTFTLSALECEHSSNMLTVHYTATSTTIFWVDPNHPDRVQNFEKQ